MNHEEYSLSIARNYLCINVSRRDYPATTKIVYLKSHLCFLSKMEKERNFKLINEEEYAKVYITFKRNSNQDEIVRNGIITPIVKRYRGKVIDVMSIGAGVGWLEDEINSNPQLKVNSILAIEPNPEHAKKLREKASHWKNTTCDIDMVYFDESYETAQRFDVILFVHSLYYIRNPIGAVAKAKSFLKPGGRIMIVMQGEKGSFELASYLHNQVKIVPSAYYTYSPENSTHLLEGLNRNNIKCRSHDFAEHLDITDFIERKDISTCNDIISFFLHSNYEDLDKKLQDDIYKMVREYATITKDKRYMFSYINSFITIENI